MSVYLTMIFLTLVFSVFAMKYSTVTGTDIKKRVPAKFFVFLILTVWCSIYAFRYFVGSDFRNYYNTFNGIIDNKMSLTEFISTQRDSLYGYLSFFSSKLFNGNWIIFSYICSFLSYFPVVYVLYKKSTDFVMSMLLYIFTFTYFSAFNGVRQSISLSLIFLAYYCFLKEKKYFLYVIFVLIAFGFHATTLIAIPFQLLSLKPLNSKLFKVTVVLLLFSYLFLWNIWSYVIDFLEFIGQSKLATDYDSLSQDGSGVVRFLVNVIPPVLGLLFYKKIKTHYSDIDSEIILLCIAAILSMFSLKNWIFSRIAAYLKISAILFLPKLECIFDSKSKKMGRFLILFLYFAYMCALLLHGDGQVLPYRFIGF